MNLNHINARYLTTLLIASAVWSMGIGCAVADWKVVKVDGRDYITAENIKTFYRFPEVNVSGKTVMWKSSALWMRGSIGSSTLVINNVTFILSHPVLKRGNDVIVSRTDLTKLIDPVLRPDFIRSAEKFDTVVIDAGHGGHDSGTVGRFGQEKHFALATAKRFGAELRKRGFKVKYTRDSDRFIPLTTRAKIGNSTPNSIFISIHFNSATRTAAQGIETFALSPAGTASTATGLKRSDFTQRSGNQRDSENIALATAVHGAVLRKLSRYKPTDRGIKRARWTVLSGLKRPGLLFEGGFVSNSTEGKRIADPRYQQDLAEGLAQAVVNYRRAIGN